MICFGSGNIVCSIDGDIKDIKKILPATQKTLHLF